jgi:autotransporter-associated beta strand protein
VLQRAASALFIGAIAGVSSSTEAATQTWSGTNSGVWDISALNWDAGAAAWTNGNDALFSGTPTNNVTSAATLTVGSLTLDNTFTGSVTMTGVGVTANTVSTVTVNGGTLVETNAGTTTGAVTAGGIGTASVAIGSGGTFHINETGNGTTGATRDLAVSNTFTGTGLLKITPSGLYTNGWSTVNLTGNLSGFTGTLDILAGASNRGKASLNMTTQASVLSSSATVKVESGAALYVHQALNYGASVELYGSGNSENLGALRLESGANQTGSVTLKGNSSIGGNGSAVTISGVIGESGGSFGFTKLGNNSLTLSGANTFSGTTTYAAGTGTLQLANSLALQNSTLNDTGTALVFASSVATHAFTLGGLTGTSGIALDDNGANAVALTVGNNNTSPAAYSGSLSGAGSLTKTGTGTLTLSGSSSYTGATTVNGGTLVLGGTGDINGSSGITINGSTAKYVKTSSTAGIVPITLTQGTLDGTGAVGAVTVGNGTGGLVTNGGGNGGTSTLTMDALTFNGAGAISLNKASDTSTVALAVTGAFTTTAANGQITLNVLTAPAWTNGSTYNLISYGSFNGANTDFTLGTIAGLGGRQSATLGNTGAGSGFITLAIAGDTPVWTGAANANWTTTAQPSPFNWKLQTAGTGTQFLTNDQVLFDDTATGTTAINIADASVSPATVVFNNSSKNYSVSSSGGFGIASGSVSKSGSGSLTLNTANTYSGGTTLNGGTLNINHASALGTGSLTIAAGTTIDNTSGSAVTLSTNNAQFWNGDFTFGGSNDLNLGTGAVTLASTLFLTTNGAATLTVGGVIGGPAGAGLVKEGTGTLALNGANTFDGGVTIDAGTVRVGNASALGTSTTSLTFGSSSNGKLQVNGTALVLSGIDGDNTATIENSNVTNGTLTVGGGFFDGILQNGSAGTLALAKTGAGTLTLTGANTYSGGTTLNAGTLEVGGSSALGTGSVTVNGGTISSSTAAVLANAITLNGAATFSATNDALTINGNITGSPTGNWTLTPTNKITLAGTNNLTMSGNFTGLIVNGGAGGVDITGSTTINGNAGNAQSGYMNVRGDVTVTVQSGGSLTINPTTNTGPGGFIGQDAAGTSTVLVNGGSFAIGGNMGFGLGNNRADAIGVLTISSGTATIVAGSATATDVRSFIAMGRDSGTGIINLNGGTLATGRNFVRDGSGTADVAGEADFVFGGGTLQALANQSDWLNSTTKNTNQLALSSVTVTAISTIDSNGFNVGINSAISGPGGFIKAGAGTLSLGGVNTFTGGMSVQAGTLSLASNITLDDTITLSLASGTTLDLAFVSGSETVAGLTLNGFVVDPGTYTATDLNALGSASSINFTSSGGTLTVAAVPEPGTVTLLCLGLVCGLFVFRRRMKADSLS